MEAVIFLWDYKFTRNATKKYSGYYRVLITDQDIDEQEDADYSCYDKIYKADLENYPQVEEVVKDVLKKYKIKMIFAMIEPMIELAGHLRSLFEIKGQSYADSLTIRDKSLMKKILSDNNIKTAQHKVVSDYHAIENFIQSSGYPVILKPTRGYGTVNTCKIASEKELDEYLKNCNGLKDMQIEQFIEGAEYHCDALVRGNEVIFSSVGKYLYPLLTSIIEKKVMGSIVLPHAHSRDSVIEKIISINKQVIRILKLSDVVCHSELFATKNGDIYFGEIGARIGGGPLLGTCIENTFGVNIYDAFIDLGFNNYVHTQHNQDIYTGHVCLPTKAGTIKKMTTAAELREKFEGIKEIRLRYKIGSTIKNVNDTITRAGHVIVEDKSYGSLVKKLHAIYDFFTIEV